MAEADEAIWTEEDQAFSDFVSDLACEISAEEDVVHDVLGALMERGLLSRGQVIAKAEGDQ